MVDSGFFAPADLNDSGLASSVELLHESEGGWSQLYLIDRAGKFRVLKALKPEYRGLLQYETILRKEFEISYRLSHPEICEAYTFTNLPELGNCIEMEWVDGETLAAFLSQGVPSFDISRDILLQLCSALEYCHSKQVIHRDIKPENIMLTHVGRHVKLIDFGLADSAGHSILKSPCGTESFAAPEVLSGGSADERSDIYSLGKIIGMMHPRFRSVAARCAKEAPSERYGSIAELRHALLRVRKVSPIVTVVSLVLILAVSAWMIGRPDAPSAAASVAVAATETPTEETIVETTAAVSAPTLEVKPSAISVESPTPAVEKQAPIRAIDSTALNELFRTATEMIPEI